jgi:hypothetical protein
MKTSITLISLLLASVSFAQSSFERDLAKLTEDRDKALVRASDPIQRKYKELLEQLMQRATRNGDLDAAIKIKDAIAKIPASILVTKPHPKTAQELREFLDGTIWNISDKSPTGEVLYTLTFDKNGTFKHSDGRTGKFEVTGPNDFKMWGYDPATLNKDFNQFRAVASATVYFGNLKAD